MQRSGVGPVAFLPLPAEGGGERPDGFHAEVNEVGAGGARLLHGQLQSVGFQ